MLFLGDVPEKDVLSSKFEDFQINHVELRKKFTGTKPSMLEILIWILKLELSMIVLANRAFCQGQSDQKLVSKIPLSKYSDQQTIE